MRHMLFACLFLLVAGPARAASLEESMHFVAASPDFVALGPADGVAVDLRYATANNFVGRNMYGEFRTAYLHRVAAAKLLAAAAGLKRLKPDYRLVIFDALRPRSVQQILWDHVKGTDGQNYVANPAGGSVHNYGFAVDLSILDGAGRELDMGTPFDDFTELAKPRLEARFLAEGRLTAAQVANRHLLRGVMEEAGFTQLPIEWWHFDAMRKAEIKARYRIVE